MKTPSKQLTFNFFDYKWRMVPQWAVETEEIYRKWYLLRYGYKTIDALKDFLKDKTRILEAGCGLARDSKMFAECNPNARILAIDQSPAAVGIAKQTLGGFRNCSVARADITTFETVYEFDFISCDQVLHHTPNPTETLAHLYKLLRPGGVLNFFVCRKKNELRDLADDVIMDHARGLTPERLWKFAEDITRFGKTLHDLGTNEITFRGQKYENIQRFVHNQLFRCWYNPEIGFDLSVSSNYDWFSGNPRFSATEVLGMMEGLKPYTMLSFFQDDASISVSMLKL